MKPFLILLLILSACTSKSQPVYSTSIAPTDMETSYLDRLEEKKSDVEKYLLEHPTYNRELAFFIDFRIPSNRYRFFIFDLKNDSILDRGLVAHGSGSYYSEDSLIFSNIPESYQSSLGYYKIGAKYQGSFGKSYKLHGLSASNSNAYKRLIVLHPYTCVPDEEQDWPICYSLGCPMVSNDFMRRLYNYIDPSSKPILLLAYY